MRDWVKEQVVYDLMDLLMMLDIVSHTAFGNFNVELYVYRMRVARRSKNETS